MGNEVKCELCGQTFELCNYNEKDDFENIMMTGACRYCDKNRNN